jgi:DNA-binding Lrp family transcriptional regulator
MGRGEWTFITNHGSVLAIIGEQGQITSREIAERLGITERTVQRIISDLDREGYIDRRKVGRRNHYEVNRQRPLRREDQRGVQVAALLRVLDGA